MRYFFIVLVTVSVLVSSYISFNYLTDTINIFHRRAEPFEVHHEINERYMKYLYLKETCRNFNTIVLGSSRATGFSSTDVAEQLGENSGGAYNYAVQADTILGAYQKLQWLAEKECVPEKILIPISIDRVVVKDYSDTNRLIFREPPEVVGLKPWTYEYLSHQFDVFKKYLFSSTVFEINLKKIRNLVTNRDPNLKYYPSSGDTHYYFEHPCVELSHDIGVDIISDEAIAKFVKVLEDIRTLIEHNGVEVYLVWNPQLYHRQMAYNLDGVRSFIQAIANVFPEIYRLPLTDKRLKDINQYNDCSHFKKPLGKSLLDPGRKVRTVQLAKEFEAEHLRLSN